MHFRRIAFKNQITMSNMSPTLITDEIGFENSLYYNAFGSFRFWDLKFFAWINFLKNKNKVKYDRHITAISMIIIYVNWIENLKM